MNVGMKGDTWCLRVTRGDQTYRGRENMKSADRMTTLNIDRLKDRNRNAK